MGGTDPRAQRIVPALYASGSGRQRGGATNLTDVSGESSHFNPN